MHKKQILKYTLPNALVSIKYHHTLLQRKPKWTDVTRSLRSPRWFAGDLLGHAHPLEKFPPAVAPTSWVSGTWSSGTYPQVPARSSQRVKVFFCKQSSTAISFQRWKKNANKLPGGVNTIFKHLFIMIPVHCGPISKSDGRFFHPHGPLIQTTSEQSPACQEFPKNHRRMNSTNCSFFRKICGKPGFKTKNTCPCSGLLASRAKSGSTMTSAPKCWAKIEAVSMQLAEGLRIRLEGRTIQLMGGKNPKKCTTGVTYHTCHTRIPISISTIYIYVYVYISIP